MTDDLHTLAAAVVQSPHWRWTVGMVDVDGWRCVDVSGECATMVGPLTWSDPERPAVCHVFWRGTEAHGGDVGAWKPRTMLPDLRDPATLGCLLALAREAWGDPTIYARHWNNTGDWCLHRRGGYRLSVVPANEKSEPAALVAALLAVPKE